MRQKALCRLKLLRAQAVASTEKRRRREGVTFASQGLLEVGPGLGALLHLLQGAAEHDLALTPEVIALGRELEGGLERLYSLLVLVAVVVDPGDAQPLLS